jgi:hypothetical protein
MKIITNSGFVLYDIYTNSLPYVANSSIKHHILIFTKFSIAKMAVLKLHVNGIDIGLYRLFNMH